jgi:hypothetical protein
MIALTMKLPIWKYGVTVAGASLGRSKHMMTYHAIKQQEEGVMSSIGSAMIIA